MVYMGDDLPFLGIGVGGNGEVQAFGGSLDGFRSRYAREWDGGRIDEGSGGGSEFCVEGGDFITRDVVDGGVGLGGRRHVAMV